MDRPPYPLHPAPMKKSWLERNPLWKIPFGCLTLVLLLGLFIITLFTVINTSFRRSDVYKEAMSRATGSLQVREQLGEPIKPAWLISGQLNVRGSTGSANLSIPILGPRGRGLIRAVAQKSGVWRFTCLRVSIEGQPGNIDLLSAQTPQERKF